MEITKQVYRLKDEKKKENNARTRPRQKIRPSNRKTQCLFLHINKDTLTHMQPHPSLRLSISSARYRNEYACA